MKTVSSFVEHYIKAKPHLLYSLGQGIINLTSLARIMMPEIEKELGKEIKQGAVVMSLKRLTEELDFRINYRLRKVLVNIGQITVRSNLTDFAFAVSDTLLQNQAKLMAELNDKKDVFYTSSRGVDDSNIVISSSYEGLVDKFFKNEKVNHKTSELSSITVKLPNENIAVPGVYYFIFQRLAWEGVVIHEVISTATEFTIIINDDQIDIAFKVIKDLKNKVD